MSFDDGRICRSGGFQTCQKAGIAGEEFAQKADRAQKLIFAV
jgi:hypothetical protein